MVVCMKTGTIFILMSEFFSTVVNFSLFFFFEFFLRCFVIECTLPGYVFTRAHGVSLPQLSYVALAS